MNYEEFKNGEVGETIGIILGGMWFTISLPVILIRWIFTKKSFLNITMSVFNTKIGRIIKTFGY